MNKATLAVCRKIVETGRLLLQAKLTEGVWGNVSARTGKKGLIAITPSGRAYDTLCYKDICIIDAQGKPQKNTFAPSSEWPLHIAIYNARPDVKAIIHTHSVYASAFAVAGQPILPVAEDMAQIVGGQIDVGGYALPGTASLAANAVDALAGKNAVLLKNHGLAVCGRNLTEALTVAVIVEKTAKIFLYAKQLDAETGGIAAEDVKILRDFYLDKYSRQQLVRD
ncbi:MAG: class II aldolase/adducin family protein [Acidaminococcales bacterium]|jgi:L-fuculose-phosphate aldolase|nr:class II aldolase/adducin family protein [Acidaminococcales bacterium]